MVGVRPKPVLHSVRGQLRRLRRSTLLLIILVAGFIDVALLGSFAMGPQVDRKVATASKLQHRLAAVASDTNFSRQRDAALAPPLILRSEQIPRVRRRSRDLTHNLFQFSIQAPRFKLALHHNSILCHCPRESLRHLHQRGRRQRKPR